MPVLKLIVNALVLFAFLPVAVVAVLGIVFSPLQTSARAVEPRTAFEVSDVMWDERNAAVESRAAGEPTALVDELVTSANPVESAAPAEPALPEGTSEPELAPETEPPATSGNVPAEPEGEAIGEAVGQQGASAGEDGLEMPNHYSSDQLRVQGVIHEGDYRYTWYSQRVLPGGGLDIEGRHVSDEGYVVDGQGRIVVASSDLPYGTELDVPFGSGRAVVLDAGCISGTIDVYTDF